MKTLLLLRHAKAVAGDEFTGLDYDRPLNEQGIEAAKMVGALLLKRGVTPDLALSSPAARTQQTLQLVVETAGIKPVLRCDERIYEARVGQLLEVIGEIEEEHSGVVLVGHNPGIEDLLRHLTGQILSMSTAALGCISLNISRWSEVSAGRDNNLEWLIKREDLIK